MNMKCSGNATGYIGLQFIVGHSFSCNELCAAVGELDDDGRIHFCRSFQRRIYGVRTRNIYCRNGKLIVFRILIKSFQFFAE